MKSRYSFFYLFAHVQQSEAREWCVFQASVRVASCAVGVVLDYRKYH